MFYGTTGEDISKGTNYTKWKAPHTGNSILDPSQKRQESNLEGTNQDYTEVVEKIAFLTVRYTCRPLKPEILDAEQVKYMERNCNYSDKDGQNQTTPIDFSDFSVLEDFTVVSDATGQSLDRSEMFPEGHIVLLNNNLSSDFRDHVNLRFNITVLTSNLSTTEGIATIAHEGGHALDYDSLSTEQKNQYLSDRHVSDPDIGDNERWERLVKTFGQESKAWEIAIRLLRKVIPEDSLHIDGSLLHTCEESLLSYFKPEYLEKIFRLASARKQLNSKIVESQSSLQADIDELKKMTETDEFQGLEQQAKDELFELIKLLEDSL